MEIWKVHKHELIINEYIFFHQKALSGECGFMAANLYAKSIFGEDALANVSLEKNPAKPDAPVTGIYTFFRQIDFWYLLHT